MATNTSAKAGRKEALRSAACRSGRRAISPGCGCGAEVGGREGEGATGGACAAAGCGCGPAAALHGKSRFVQARGLHCHRPGHGPAPAAPTQYYTQGLHFRRPHRNWPPLQQ